MPRPLSFGLNIWSHATSWEAVREVGERADKLGYSSLYTADHLLATVGDPHQPILESWTLVTALAMVTDQIEVGTLVLANTFRYPALVAKMAVTLDHVSNGRCVLGLGAGWSATEHAENGIDFGRSAGERLDWLDESVAIVHGLIAGEHVTTEGPRYQLRNAYQAPRSIRVRLPLLIGGTGMKRTLPIVARWADRWNAIGDPVTLAERSQRLDELCLANQRSPDDIERSVTIKAVAARDHECARAVWSHLCQHNGMPDTASGVVLGRPDDIAATLAPYLTGGLTSIVIDLPAPYHLETVERFQTEVRPLLESIVAADGEDPQCA